MQRPQRARPHRAGAGIAVEPGHTDGLGVSGEDLTADVALQIRVIQQRRVDLYKPAPGRQMVFDPIHNSYHPESLLKVRFSTNRRRQRQPRPMHSVQMLTALTRTSHIPPFITPITMNAAAAA